MQGKFVFAALVLGVAGCASVATDEQGRAEALALMKASFKERGQAQLDRLDQDEMQQVCSAAAGKPLDAATADRLEKAQQALIKHPADGKYVGDWKAGERIAQSGAGKQFSDDPANPSGANCYACHQLSKAEVSHGTIGPSLHHFAKLRGYGEDIQKYAYGRIYNSQAFSACSNMPRFGHNGILTEQQMKDVTALLMDPDSPVNR